MWAAVLVLLSLCSSARTQGGGGGGRAGRETNKQSVQLLAASNTHGAHTAITAAASFVKGSVHPTYKNTEYVLLHSVCLTVCFICAGFEVDLFLDMQFNLQ